MQIDKQTILNGFIAVDTETTGLNSQYDEIIELGAVYFKNNQVIDEFSSLINIHKPIPESASRVNHIYNHMIENAPEGEFVYTSFYQFMEKYKQEIPLLVAHNADFDMEFLSQAFKYYQLPFHVNYLDTLAISKKQLPFLTNYKQATLEFYFKVNNTQSHRALSDAKACGEILLKLLNV